jgi:hypothetical protein
MRRHLSTICRVLSLLACLVLSLAGLVDHGSTASREMHVSCGRRAWGVYVSGGVVYCAALQNHAPRYTIDVYTDHRYTLAMYCMVVLDRRYGLPDVRHGFGAAGHVGRPSHEMFAAAYVVSFPIWLATIVLAIPPVLWIPRGERVTRARAAGRCPSCGYDLRATPHRCPECGTVPFG